MTEVKLIDDFSKLTREEQVFVYKLSEKKEPTPKDLKEFKAQYKFLAIKNEVELISFLSYSTRGRDAFVNFIYGKTPK